MAKRSRDISEIAHALVLQATGARLGKSVKPKQSRRKTLSKAAVKTKPRTR